MNLPSIVTAVLVLLASQAAAAGTPDQQCRGRKLSASGSYMAGALSCASKAAKAGVAIDAACTTAAAGKFSAACTAAEAKAGAPCNGDAGATKGALDDAIDEIVAALPAVGADRCATLQRKATAKFALALLKAHAKQVSSADAARLTAAIAKAEARLHSAFDKAETAGVCASGLDAAVQPLVEAVVEVLNACIGSATACSQVEEEVAAGGSVTTDPTASGATPGHPVTTTIVSPVPGTVRIAESQSSGEEPHGYDVLGFRVHIDAPLASAAAPLSLTFRIDASLLPADPSTVQLARDGVPISVCTGTPGTADPDPCESARSILGDGDLSITALSSHASEWGAVEPECTLTGQWSDGTLTWNGVEDENGTTVFFANIALPGSPTPETVTITRSGSTIDAEGTAGTINEACTTLVAAPYTWTRTSSSACGDGTVDAGEDCDDGAGGTACEDFVCDSPWPANPMLQQCRFCVAPCGDGEVNGSEQCDDGNDAGGDDCSSTCRIECSLDGTWTDSISGANYDVKRQANLTIDVLGGLGAVGSAPWNGTWTRDGSSYNNGAGIINSTCTRIDVPGAFYARVSNVVCGDGVVEGNEDCDDGNRANGDGCNAQICPEPVPGFETYYICNFCLAGPVGCGDGDLDGGEQCDDGNLYIGDGCSSECTTE
jgi:cysteine-rich repeat protein